MYVAIAGNIGSGKTTLTELLTQRYGAKAYYEETDNPYIGDFYNNMSRWAFQLQISFLLTCRTKNSESKAFFCRRCQ